MRRNVAHIERGEPPFSPSKSPGRPNKVSIEQWQILCGALLFEPKYTDLQWVLTFVKDNFDVTIDFLTASRHLHAMGMSFRLTGDRTMPAGTTDLDVQHDFVLKLRNEEFFKYDPKKILCIDFVTNSRRLERTKTIALKGSKQKKMSDTAPKYTNSYLVAVTTRKALMTSQHLCLRMIPRSIPMAHVQRRSKNGAIFMGLSETEFII